MRRFLTRWLTPNADCPLVKVYHDSRRTREAAREAILRQEVAASTIRRLALSEGMRSLREDAVRKVVAGQTTPEEILRAVYLEE